ncbi:MAG: hypothetical protein HYT94_05345 [Parcubacteria group bacterium]|nr:hypothetical protein [Parcubacteria group bacterium]
MNSLNFKSLEAAQAAFEKEKRACLAAPPTSEEEREAWREAENILQFTLDNFGDERTAVEWVWAKSKSGSPLETAADEKLKTFTLVE